MSPSLLHLARAGRNSSVVVRSPIEAEIYGLKLDALLLPVEGHRLPVLETVRTTYLGMVQAVGPAWNNEAAQLAGIGLVAGSGLLFLLAWLLVGRSEWAGLLLGDRRDLVTRLATLNVGGILLATVGGMGAAVAVVLPQIRAYNRISVYLGFFSIAAIALLLDAVREQLARRGGRLAAVLLVLAVAVFGLLDQVPERDRAAAVRLARQFQHDHAFVAAIELRLGPGKAVFQLPFVPFPESPPVNRMTDYQHFRAYLHSRATRWSYGAVKGRPTSEWQQGVAALPFGEMVPELKRAGFAGIRINRGGYADAGAAILSQAQGTLGTRPIWSEGSALVFIPFE